MSDTSGLPNTDNLGVPAEDDPERFEGAGAEHDAQATEPAEDEPGQGDGVSAAHETGVAPEGAQDVTTRETHAPASHGAEGAEPPPADFDPSQQPSNPDLVTSTEPPD